MKILSINNYKEIEDPNNPLFIKRQSSRKYSFDSMFSSLKEAYYFYSNNLSEKPKCLVCNKDCTFRAEIHSYGKFCSQECTGKNSKVETKIKINEDNYQKILTKNGDIKRYSSENCIFDETKWFTSLTEAVYCYKNNITKQPKCYCGGDLTFVGTTVGYSKNCSSKCNRRLEYNPKELIPLTAENFHEVFTESGRISYKRIQFYKIPDDVYWPSDIKGYIYCLKAGVTEHPTCKECGCLLNYRESSIAGVAKGYPKFCSSSCSNKNLETSILKKETFLNKFGLPLDTERPKNTTSFYKGYGLGGFIYLIYSKELNKVKIGVFINPEERLKHVKKYAGKVEFLGLKEVDNMTYWENYLHKMFLNDQSPELHDGDGASEWFSCENLGLIIDEFNQIK